MERLDLFFNVNGYPAQGDTRRDAFLVLIGDAAYAKLRDLCQPNNPRTLPLDRLTAELTQHFTPRPSATSERVTFARRRQKEGEKAQEFLAALRKLSEYCNYGNALNGQLLTQFTAGLHNTELQSKLVEDDSRTIEVALKRAVAFERAQGEAIFVRDVRAKPDTAKEDTVHRGAKPRYDKQRQRDSTQRDAPQQACTRCDRKGHTPATCWHKNATCNFCHKKGHISTACKGKKKTDGKPRSHYRKGTHHVEDEDDDDTFMMHSLSLNAITRRSTGPWIVKPELEGVTIPMEVDTGSPFTLIPEDIWTKTLNLPLQPSDLKLFSYTKDPLSLRGKCEVNVELNGQKMLLTVHIARKGGATLIGRDWLRKLRLNWDELRVHHLSSPIATLIDRYGSLFSEEQGELKGFTAHLALKEGAQPSYIPAREIPYAMRAKVEADLDRLVKRGVIYKVKHSKWASPIVVVPKPDNAIRVCGDYKPTVNPQLKVDQYPLPRPDDLINKLRGGKIFTKLDLASAYQQVILDEASREIVTISTHKGLFQYTRLPFGVASAPAIFQNVMDQILRGLNGVVCYLDDILITGKDEEEHARNLEAVLKKLAEHHVRLKKNKCIFTRSSVEYLGFTVSADGISPTPKKTEAILSAPRPENLSQLRSFLGLVNYYGRFISNLSNLCHPLNALLQHDTKWNWTNECEKSFKSLKTKLSSDDILVHYNPDWKLCLACDASPYGVGAVLSHVTPEGHERPIAYASRTLSKPEKNYSQIDKEALGIIFGVKKFHIYLYGRQFELITDHQPLTKIFGPREKLSVLAAARLQRWAILLSAYTYSITYRSSQKHANADGFSRLPVNHIESSAEGAAISASVNLTQLNFLPLTSADLANATRNDPVLAKVLRLTQRGWPETSPTDPEVKQYFSSRRDLTIEGDCLLRGLRVVIPTKLRTKLLEKLHSSHQRVVKMKSLDRCHIWWPQIDKDIEHLARSCPSCQSNAKMPGKVILHPWVWPERPFQQFHIDFAGPFLNSMFLLLVDAHSKWLEVIPMKTTTSQKTIDALRDIFARFGLPELLVSDNGPQFVSKEFQEWLARHGIQHIRSSPYHPQSNGAAERCVQTFKNALKAMKGETDMKAKLATFLFKYRNTPHTTTGLTPSELFLGRQVRTRLTMLHPDVAARIRNKQLKQQAYHGHATRNFQIGDKVWAKDYTSGERWVEGTISNKPGSVDYDVTVNDKTWHRHADQLRPTAATEMSMAARDESEEDQPRKEATSSLPVAINVPASDTSSSESTTEA